MTRRGDSTQAVLLDAGGTLIESRPSAPEVYARVLAEHGHVVSAAAVAPAFAAVWSAMTQEHPRGLDRYHHLKGGEREWWGEFLRRVLARLDCPAEWEPVLDALFAAFSRPELWRVFPEVVPVLEDLCRSGYHLAVVSNWDSRLPALLDGLGLSRHFRQVLVSSVEGVEKPSPEIFHRAAARLGVSPGACVHVGDSPLDDYRGAESAGVGAVLLDRTGAFDNGYRRISDLRGLHDLLT